MCRASALVSGRAPANGIGLESRGDGSAGRGKHRIHFRFSGLQRKTHVGQRRRALPGSRSVRDMEILDVEKGRHWVE